MKQVHKHLSKESAIENVKKLFSNTSEDTVSLEAAFSAWGRDPQKQEQNKIWLSNKMVEWRYHNLVLPFYELHNNHKTLVKIMLTLEGKKALGRIDIPNFLNNGANANNIQSSTPVSVTDAMKIIAQLRKDNPEYEITFDIKLKEIA